MSDDLRRVSYNEDYLEDITAETRAANSAEWIDAPGVTFLGRWSLTRTGPAIASTSVTVTELTGTKKGYRFQADKSVMANLAAYEGRKVCMIISKTGDLDCGYLEYLVVAARQVA